MSNDNNIGKPVQSAHLNRALGRGSPMKFDTGVWLSSDLQSAF